MDNTYIKYIIHHIFTKLTVWSHMTQFIVTYQHRYNKLEYVGTRGLGRKSTKAKHNIKVL